MSTFRYLDENLKNKWKGINDDVPVNSSMYVVTEMRKNLSIIRIN